MIAMVAWVPSTTCEILIGCSEIPTQSCMTNYQPALLQSHNISKALTEFSGNGSSLTMGSVDSHPETCPCCSLEKGSKEVLPSSDSSSSSLSSASVPSSPRETPREPPPAVPAVPAVPVAPSLPEVPLSARSTRSNFSVRTEVLAEHVAAPAAEAVPDKAREVPSASEETQTSNQPSDVSELKRSLKAFVQQMVRGRDVQIHEDGTLKLHSCKLSKKVDAIILEPKVIPLVEISHVHRGMEAVPLALPIELSPSWIVLDARHQWYFLVKHNPRTPGVVED